MKVYKYHVLGNKILLVDYETVKSHDLSDLSKTLCDNDISLGADGIIYYKLNPITMIFYNKDGSEATFCGNGLRILAHHLHSNKIIENRDIEIIVSSKKYRVNIFKSDPYIVEVSLKNNPVIEENKVSIGNEHLIEVTCDFTVECKIEDFNVNLVQVLNPNLIKVKTCERGVGYTLCCTSGNMASFLYLLKNDYVDDFVVCKNKIGSMSIYINDDYVSSLSESTFICEAEVNVDI